MSHRAIPYKLQDTLQKAGVLVIYPFSLEEMKLLSNILGCLICDEFILEKQKIQVGSKYTASVPLL